MAIEFINYGYKLMIVSNKEKIAHIDLFHKKLPMLIQYVPLDANDLEQILTKMKELQGDKV